MRISIILAIFFILLNSWAGLLQANDIDDHLGISPEVGEHEELQSAQDSASSTRIGAGGVFESITGIITTLGTSFQNIIMAVNPGAQILSNVVSSGIASDLIVWAFGVIEIVIAIDIINYARGMR